MKTFQIFFIFSLLLMFQKAVAQQVQSVEIQVNGLTCSMCSQATEKSLQTLSYVEKVTPDLNRNLFVVSFKKGSTVNFDQLYKKVKDAGFSVGKLDAMIDFNQTKIDDNGQATAGSHIYHFVNTKNKILNGLVKVSLIDRNFVPANVFKQKLNTIKADSYATGMGVVNGQKTRIYHLSI